MLRSSPRGFRSQTPSDFSHPFLIQLRARQTTPADKESKQTHSKLRARRGGGVDVDGGSSDTGEQQVEDHVIFTVEKEDFAVGAPEFAAEGFCKLYGGESSADDDYPDWFHCLPIAWNK
ncbi:MAG: hypothetical protein WAM58_12175 [Candidatus Acidiferrum sp.]